MLMHAAEASLMRCALPVDFTTWEDSLYDEEDIQNYRRHMSREIFVLAAERNGGTKMGLSLLAGTP